MENQPPAIDSSNLANGAVDFSAFTSGRPVSKLPLSIGLFGLATFIVGIIGTAMISASVGDKNLSGVYGACIFAGFVIAAVGFIVYVYRRNKQLKAEFAAFLAANGWSLTSPSSFNNVATSLRHFSNIATSLLNVGQTNDSSFNNVATSLLNVGHDQAVKSEFSGRYHDLPFSGVIYEYTTGSGRYQQKHYFVNLHFTLMQNFPLVVLDDKRNNLFFISNLPERIPGSKSLQLESDFGDRFKITVMPESERDVLQVLTPDFMAELMDSQTNVDIELEANHLFLIQHLNRDPVTFDGKTLQALFATADVMLKNINEAARTWQASSSPETVQAMTERAMNARKRILLQPRRIGGLSIIAIVIYIFIQAISDFLSTSH